MDGVMQFIQTLGFPIAVAVGLCYYCYIFTKRVMDENKAREDKYHSLLTEYGVKMSEICEALADIKSDIKELKTKD